MVFYTFNRVLTTSVFLMSICLSISSVLSMQEPREAELMSFDDFSAAMKRDPRVKLFIMKQIIEYGENGVTKAQYDSMDPGERDRQQVVRQEVIIAPSGGRIARFLKKSLRVVRYFRSPFVPPSGEISQRWYRDVRPLTDGSPELSEWLRPRRAPGGFTPVLIGRFTIDRPAEWFWYQLVPDPKASARSTSDPLEKLWRQVEPKINEIYELVQQAPMIKLLCDKILEDALHAALHVIYIQHPENRGNSLFQVTRDALTQNLNLYLYIFSQHTPVICQWYRKLLAMRGQTVSLEPTAPLLREILALIAEKFAFYLNLVEAMFIYALGDEEELVHRALFEKIYAVNARDYKGEVVTNARTFLQHVSYALGTIGKIPEGHEVETREGVNIIESLVGALLGEYHRVYWQAGHAHRADVVASQFFAYYYPQTRYPDGLRFDDTSTTQLLHNIASWIDRFYGEHSFPIRVVPTPVRREKPLVTISEPERQVVSLSVAPVPMVALEPTINLEPKGRVVPLSEPAPMVGLAPTVGLEPKGMLMRGGPTGGRAPSPDPRDIQGEGVGPDSLSVLQKLLVIVSERARRLLGCVIILHA